MFKPETILETGKPLKRQFPFPLLKPDTGILEIIVENKFPLLRK
jgi:hypothetical protein